MKPVVTLGQRHTSPNQVSLNWRPSTLFWKRKNLITERDSPLCLLKEKQGHSNSSFKTTKQNQNCHWDPDNSWTVWMIKCGKDKKTIFDECHRKKLKTFYELGNVHVCNIGISSIHGKGLLGKLSFYHEYKRPHIETNVRKICMMSVWTRWDLWSGNNWLGKSIMEMCLWLVMKELSISSAQRSTSFQILYFVFVRNFRTPNQTVHGKTDRDVSKIHRNTENLAELTVSQRNSSVIFSRIPYVAAQSRGQRFTVEIKCDTRKFCRKDYLHVDV